MKRSRIDEIAARAGMKVAADDDPRYREGTSMVLKSSPIVLAPTPTVEDDENDLSPDADTESCPYCNEDACPHHATSLDLTFREVVGGELYNAANACLGRIRITLSGGDEDADVEFEAFEQLEEVLESLPGVVGIASEWSGGPGQSSAVRHYWVEEANTMIHLAARLDAIHP